MKEFDALIQRKQANDNRERLNVGIVAAALYNTALGTEDRTPVSPFDFVPEWKQVVEAEEYDLTKMTPEQQKIHIMNTLFKRRY